MNWVDFDPEFWFPVTPDRLWATIERFDHRRQSASLTNPSR